VRAARKAGSIINRATLEGGFNVRSKRAKDFVTQVDHASEEAIIDVVRKAAGDGRTFILAIHQLADAARVCDRFILLAGGQVRGIGSLRELRMQTGVAQGSLEEIFLALT